MKPDELAPFEVDPFRIPEVDAIWSGNATVATVGVYCAYREMEAALDKMGCTPHARQVILEMMVLSLLVSEVKPSELVPMIRRAA
jgi:hypothetical protein